MSSAESDVAASSKLIANLSERVEQTNADQGKIITKHGEDGVSSVDADRLEDSRQSERERTHMLLIDDVTRGLADIAAGRHVDADAALAELQRKRSSVRLVPQHDDR